MLMSAVTTGAWSLPGSRLAVRAFLSPRIDELSRKTWQHRGGGGGRVLWGLAGLLLYFLFVETLIVFQEKKRADRSDWIFKYQRVPFSSPPHYSMSPGSLFFFCSRRLSSSFIPPLQSSPPSCHLYLLLSPSVLSPATVCLGVTVTSPLLTVLCFHPRLFLRDAERRRHMGTFTDSFMSAFLQAHFPPIPSLRCLRSRSSPSPSLPHVHSFRVLPS